DQQARGGEVQGDRGEGVPPLVERRAGVAVHAHARAVPVAGEGGRAVGRVFGGEPGRAGADLVEAAAGGRVVGGALAAGQDRVEVVAGVRESAAAGPHLGHAGGRELQAARVAALAVEGDDRDDRGGRVAGGPGDLGGLVHGGRLVEDAPGGDVHRDAGAGAVGGVPQDVEVHAEPGAVDADL